LKKLAFDKYATNDLKIVNYVREGLKKNYGKFHILGGGVSKGPFPLSKATIMCVANKIFAAVIANVAAKSSI